MEPRNFKEDFENSNNPELRNNWLKIFKKKFGENIEVVWKDCVDIQKSLGTDVTIKTSKGRRYSVELKTRNNNCLGRDWIMEVKNHWYTEQDKESRRHIRSYDGWIYTTTAEYIFHGTLDKEGKDIVECIFYSLYPFKTEKWMGEFSKYDNLWLSTGNKPFHLTLNKLIPKEVIAKDAIEFWEWRQDGTKD